MGCGLDMGNASDTTDVWARGRFPVRPPSSDCARDALSGDVRWVAHGLVFAGRSGKMGFMWMKMQSNWLSVERKPGFVSQILFEMTWGGASRNRFVGRRGGKACIFIKTRWRECRSERGMGSLRIFLFRTVAMVWHSVFSRAIHNSLAVSRLYTCIITAVARSQDELLMKTHENKGNIGWVKPSPERAAKAAP